MSEYESGLVNGENVIIRNMVRDFFWRQRIERVRRELWRIRWGTGLVRSNKHSTVPVNIIEVMLVR